jgi:hypothetical protein
LLQGEASALIEGVTTASPADVAAHLLKPGVSTLAFRASSQPSGRGPAAGRRLRRLPMICVNERRYLRLWPPCAQINQNCLHQAHHGPSR